LNLKLATDSHRHTQTGSDFKEIIETGERII